MLRENSQFFFEPIQKSKERQDDRNRRMGGRKGAIILIFRLMAGGLNFKADRNRMRTVLYSTVQYCTVLYNTVRYCTVVYSTVQ